MTTEVPFNIGSETSQEAAESKVSTAATDEARVLGVIRERGVRGATDDEIERSTGLRHQNASARRNRLVHKGLIKDSGMRRLTRSGRRAIVWILGEDPSPPSGPTPVGPPRRPSDAEIRTALGEIVVGVGEPSSALVRLTSWLRAVSR